MNDNVLRAFMESVAEVLRLKQLNMELLETLEETMLWFKDYHEKTGIPIPHVDRFVSLASKMNRLIDEINSTPSVQHLFQTPSNETESSIRRKFTGDESNEDLTEPKILFWITHFEGRIRYIG